MKAWKIRRARKKLAKWNDYIVSESSDLFGGPYKQMGGRSFKAECAESAIRRALKYKLLVTVLQLKILML